MFIKPSKKWRNPEGNDSIMVPYTYYRLCESYRDTDGKVKQRTVLGLGELLDFPTELERKELAEIQTALGIPALPVCSIKSVWPQERPPEKDPPSKSGG